MLTWKGPTPDFHSHFRRIQSTLPALPIQLISRGRKVHFLDATIEHHDGILHTSIYRPRLIEHYIVPYLSKYPLDQYAAHIRRHLIHMIRLCNNMEDFREEHTFMHVLYSLNGFPSDFITDCVNRFFHEVNPSKLYIQYDQQAYQHFRSQCVQNQVRMCNRLLINNKRLHDEDSTMEISVKRVKT